MTFDRALWTQTLSKDFAPPWPCPSCVKGTLRLEPKTLSYRETIASRRVHGDEDWDPTSVDYAFTAWLKCSEPSCGEGVAVAGTGGLEPVWDAEAGQGWEEFFMPRLLCPMPDMFTLPRKCPAQVVQALRSAFASSLHDPPAAAGKVRVALERLMDHVGVKKRRKGGNKVVDLSLHQRIQAFQVVEPDLGNQLMALKWLGNTGTHESAINRDDLLDAFEILDHAVSELIDQRSKRVAALARRMIKKHARHRKP